MNLSRTNEGQARPGLIIGLAVVVAAVIGVVVFLKPSSESNRTAREEGNQIESTNPQIAPVADGNSGMDLIGRSKTGSRSHLDAQNELPEDDQLSLSESFQKAMSNRIAAVRDKELKRLAEQFAAQNPAAASDLIKNEWENGPRNKAPLRKFTSEFGKAYAGQKPKLAGAMVESLPPELQMQYAVAVGAQWASSDAGGATQWALQMADPNIQNGLLGAISGVVEQSGSPFLIDPWADALTRSSFAGDYAQQLARTWPISNADAAMEWVNAIPDPELRFSSFQSMADAMAGRNFEEAALWVAQFPEDSGIRDQAVDQVSYGWSKSDHEAAKSWAESLGRPLLNEVPDQAYEPQQP